MRKTLLAATLAVLSAGAGAETRLTVYSGDFDAVAASLPAPGMPGYALVRQTLSLQADANGTVTLTGLPAAIDAAGVRFDAKDANVAVAGQRFDFALTDQSELLRRAVGRQVGVNYSVGNEARRALGTLLAAGDGLTLQTGAGVLVLRDYDSFTADLPDGVYAQPTLRWSVTGAAGSEQFVLDYPTGGLAWRAEYVATLANDCRMDFGGAAQVVNRSGASFDAAALVLVAGQPNLQPAAGAPQPLMFKAETRAGMAADAAPPPQAAGEYHAYPLPGRIDLPQGSVQRVPLLAQARGVSCTRRYEARSPMGYFRPAAPIVDPGFGPEGEIPVLATLEFANRKQAGLGVPLPAGRLRVFSGEHFLGEAALAHTPEGREVRAELGQAFDLTLQRTRKDLQLDADRLGLTERIELVLRNAKDEAATVRVHESLPRWSDWEIVEASTPWKRQDAQTAVFDVPLPAHGETTVTYSVRYRWPETLKPL